ncbi:MAG TPA: sulfotransferase [Steroidobacteraceae bacterium]|nr:sulfotransferase [Steroidobacteraceae bacterium]
MEAIQSATPSRIETEVGHVRELLKGGNYARALEIAQALRAEVPENRDVLYMIAVAQRYLQRLPEALATLAELEALHPSYPRLFQERGHCYVAQRAAPQAIEAFEQAVRLNPALPASWKVLQTLYRMTGQSARALDADREVAKLASLPAPLVTAFSMFADGEIAGAEQVVRSYLREHGDHIEGMRLLAQIGVKLDILDDAEVLLANVIARVPEYHAARYEYAIVLLGRHKHLQARAELERLLATDPGNRIYRTTYATICAGLGDYERALPIYRELLAGAPGDADLHLSVGHALKTRGQTAQAIEAYRAAAAARPSFGDAYWSLANLKTYRFSAAEIERMRAEERNERTRPVDRYHLAFALGKALEDRGEYAESFAYYERGNALKKTECRYRPGITERNVRLQKAVCTREFFAARAGYGAASAAPIFIVGLPRAGSTLIEQILASHSRVEGTMELADIPRLAAELQGRDNIDAEPRYPAVLAELEQQEFRRMGERYLADTRPYRSGKPCFIDKMPNNFRHLGLIHLILPNAKIIDARREPLACCFSNYKQLFASGQQFTYSLEDIARYYRCYVELMAHWEQALPPGRLLRVQHEELVENFEPSVRRILEHCELEFEPACLSFYNTERSVHSASSEQVRQPLNRGGLDQWRHFEPWLGPLKQALGELVAPEADQCSAAALDSAASAEPP